MGVGCFCSVAFPKLIARAFTNDPDLLDVTANGLRISLLVFVVVGSQISISQFFQSIGIAWKAMFFEFEPPSIVPDTGDVAVLPLLGLGWCLVCRSLL